MRGTAKLPVCDHCTEYISGRQRFLTYRADYVLGSDRAQRGQLERLQAAFGGEYNFCSEECAHEWFTQMVRGVCNASVKARRIPKRRRKDSKS